MDFLQQSFSVKFDYKVYFTSQLFSISNPTFKHFIEENKVAGAIQKLLFVVDENLVLPFPELEKDLKTYFSAIENIHLISEIIYIKGGEAAKNDLPLFYAIVNAINANGIDRHSYLVAIGGGSLLDLAGYAAAVSHRGVRHIRIPTTVLSQNDSGVGVKNGINFFDKKNFLGCFSPPIAVFNDFEFLKSLPAGEWRSGIAEALKVSLIKDESFFNWLEQHAKLLTSRDMPAMQYLIRRCAELHLQHIASGDPFEKGSSRPLDFGHWSAHKLEQLTNFSIRHGEAVALGIALDSTYSQLSGRISLVELDRILQLITAFGFQISHPLLKIDDENSPLLQGLNEFREHLGGKLTIMLLSSIGKGEEVNEMNAQMLKESSEFLLNYSI